jgi:hypothetical protein
LAAHSRPIRTEFAADSPLEESGFEPLVPLNLRRRRFSEHQFGLPPGCTAPEDGPAAQRRHRYFLIALTGMLSFAPTFCVSDRGQRGAGGDLYRRNAHAPLCAVRTPTITGRATSLPLTPILLLAGAPVRESSVPGPERGNNTAPGSDSNFDDNVAPLYGGGNGV